MPSASRYMGEKCVQEFGPRFLACHVPNVACHGVSISIVSISSVSCHVRILRVSMSMPCRGHSKFVWGWSLNLGAPTRCNLCTGANTVEEG